MTILVVGGAGYIGSQMVRYLLDRNISVAVLDNFSTGHREAIPSDVRIFEVDLMDFEKVTQCFAAIPDLDSVMHFAALSIVADSAKNPELYYRTNLIGALNLLAAMRKHEINKLVFSSTAAVYGNPERVPISITHPTRPINPYGQSKLMIENILKDFALSYGFKVATLRYFNAAGADLTHNLGERHQPETHLIPLLLNAIKTQGSLNIYGNDYKTPDGTCVRDYIHVLDLCEAHALALKFLDKNDGFHVYNLGTEHGTSIGEMIKVAEKITQQKVRYNFVSRRAGDPAVLIADSSLTFQMLGWRPVHSDIDRIVADAWAWCQQE